MGEAYSIPMRKGEPSGSPSTYTDKKKIDRLLASSDPGAVTVAGRSYQKFAAAYEDIGHELLKLRDDLHEAWQGRDAAAAQKQLREVWASATTVHRTARDFGIALERHGSERLAWYKNSKPPSKDLTEARQWMTGANQRITQTWGEMPPDISTTLPNSGLGEHGPAGSRHSPGGFSGTGSPNGSPGTGSPGAYGDSGSPPETTSVGWDASGGGGAHFPNGTTIGGDPFDPSMDAGGTELASLGGMPGGLPGVGSGLGPPSSGIGIGGLGSGGGTSLPGGIASGGGAPGVVGGRIGSGIPSVTEPGGLGSRRPSTRPRSVAEGRSLAETEAAEAAAQRRAAGAAAREGMFPLGAGGGGNRNEQERSRETWLAEDDDVWTGEAEVAPQVIDAELVKPDVMPEPADDEEGGADTLELIGELQAKLDELTRKTKGVELKPGEDGVLYREWDLGFDW